MARENNCVIGRIVFSGKHPSSGPELETRVGVYGNMHNA